MIVYKTVHISKNDSGEEVFESCYAYTNPETCVQYRIGEKSVGPKGTPLMAFSDEHMAIALYEMSVGFAISRRAVFECEAELYERRVKRGIGEYVEEDDYVVISNTLIDFVKFWNNKRYKAKFSKTYAPSGTVLCKSITLLRRIK